jgi:hypothetical protein
MKAAAPIAFRSSLRWMLERIGVLLSVAGPAPDSLRAVAHIHQLPRDGRLPSLTGTPDGLAGLAAF